MWVAFEDIDIKDPPYHKSVSDKIVDEMYKEWNPVVAGFLVANVRDTGKIALVDGRHRRAMAEKAGERGWQFIVTHGLKVDEEAKLFRWFQARKNMKQSERLRALIVEKDPAALRLRAAVASKGCCFPFDEDKSRLRVQAVDALVWMFERGGDDAVKLVLGHAVGAWLGAPTSLNSQLLRSLWIFLSNEEVKETLDEEKFSEVLKKQSPDNLVQRGRIQATQERCGAAYGIASILRYEYNRAIRGRGRRIKFDFVHSPIPGRSPVRNLGVANGSNGCVNKTGDPPITPDIEEELLVRKNYPRRVASSVLQAHVKAAIKDGYAVENIMSTYMIGIGILSKARKSLFLESRKEKRAAGSHASITNGTESD
jgi:hypothetical protein